MARLRNTDDGAGVTEGLGTVPAQPQRRRKRQRLSLNCSFDKDSGKWFAFEICEPAAAQAAFGEGVAICVEQTVGPHQSCHGALLGIWVCTWQPCFRSLDPGNTQG